MRTDLRADWTIPATSPGWAGRIEQFMGPGKTRSESAVEYVGGAVCVLLLLTYCRPELSDRSIAERVVLVLVVLDLVGGVLTNATNSAKRWYHRTRSSRGRLAFVAAHTLHLAVVGLWLLGDPAWFLGNTVLLIGSALLVWFIPLFFLKLLICHLIPEIPVATGERPGPTE
ncbi:hypothetical protein [Nocardia sp. MW-W600-9]